MSNILTQELQRREKNAESLITANKDLALAIQQFTTLDKVFKDKQIASRLKLEALYKERKRYSDGSWPIVYTEATTEVYPYYQGDTDAVNPYFRLSAVKAGDIGIDPIYAPISRTTPSVFNRVRTFSPTESVGRLEFSSVLNAYPDYSGEPYPLGGQCTGETPPGSGTTEALCILNGGIWAEDTWNPSESAPMKLMAALDKWRIDLVNIRSDIYTAEPDNMLILYNNVISEVDRCKSLLPAPPIYPNRTPSPTGDLLDSINKLKNYVATSIPNSVTTRVNRLTTLSEKEEDFFFSIIKMRLHQGNGSYSKLRSAQMQINVNTSILEDNKKAAETISKLINS